MIDIKWYRTLTTAQMIRFWVGAWNRNKLMLKGKRKKAKGRRNVAYTWLKTPKKGVSKK